MSKSVERRLEVQHDDWPEDAVKAVAALHQRVTMLTTERDDAREKLLEIAAILRTILDEVITRCESLGVTQWSVFSLSQARRLKELLTNQ